MYDHKFIMSHEYKYIVLHYYKSIVLCDRKYILLQRQQANAASRREIGLRGRSPEPEVLEVRRSGRVLVAAVGRWRLPQLGDLAVGLIGQAGQPQELRSRKAVGVVQ